MLQLGATDNWARFSTENRVQNATTPAVGPTPKERIMSMDPAAIHIRIPKHYDVKRIVRLFRLVRGQYPDRTILSVAKNDGAHWAIVTFLSRHHRDRVLAAHEQNNFPLVQLSIPHRPCERVSESIADEILAGARSPLDY